jgi:hypothetical protein
VWLMSERTSTRKNGNLMSKTITKAEGGGCRPRHPALPLLAGRAQTDFLGLGLSGGLSRGSGQSAVGSSDLALGYPPPLEES